MRKVTALESYLKGATKAEILALTHMELHPRDAKLLNDFLSLSPYVRKLELNGNHLSKAGMSIITPSLKASRTLTILSISGVNLHVRFSHRSERTAQLQLSSGRRDSSQIETQVRFLAVSIFSYFLYAVNLRPPPPRRRLRLIHKPSKL
jgi:hypothetical protein